MINRAMGPGGCPGPSEGRVTVPTSPPHRGSSPGDSRQDSVTENGVKASLTVGSPRVSRAEVRAVFATPPSRLDTQGYQTAPRTTETSEAIEENVEVALLQAELENEVEKLGRERRRAEGVRCHIIELSLIDQEKQKERERVERQREELHRAQERLQAARRAQDGGKEKEEAEAVDAAQKVFEDFEFQMLERLSALEEERETQARTLLWEEMQAQRRVTLREERVRCLEKLITCVQERGPDTGQHVSPVDRAVQAQVQRPQTVWIPPSGAGVQGDPLPLFSGPCVFTTASLSVTQGVLKESALSRNLSRSFCLNHKDMAAQQRMDQTGSMEKKGVARPPTQRFSLDSLHQSPLPAVSTSPSQKESLEQAPSARTSPRRVTRLTRTARASSFHGDSLTILVEMEQSLRKAMAEKQRLLLAREGERGKREGVPEREEGAERGEMDVPMLQPNRPNWTHLPARPLDLRGHVEDSGHGVGSCPHIHLSSSSCRGFLTKVGGRIKSWRKRWFVFDSRQGHLSYYTDKGETKRKGVIYFQAIEEVYFDHLRDAPKSPSPLLTFCLKTYDRRYYLVAPSDVALRIWMEVILTTVEGARHS
ncbi:pleckstrin homology-like domain family B member 3 isoform X2 [Narcine bancroftii]|uniref:pleckstrin homology-like domain family B member 3 isoform X2 n=1 Tax=Narcine bancroftii TaxID=1343680 RepID=UPI003831B8A3